MSKRTVGAFALVAAIGLLGAVSYAVAGSGTSSFSTRPLSGYAENPDVSTGATGSFDARLSQAGHSLLYELGYSGLEGTITQAHVHFAKPGVTGGISLWLCQTATNPAPTAGIPVCPPSGTVTGEVDATDVVGPAAQGIAPGEFAEILAALRAGRAYANVHTTKFPGGELRAQINDLSRDG